MGENTSYKMTEYMENGVEGIVDYINDVLVDDSDDTLDLERDARKMVNNSDYELRRSSDLSVPAADPTYDIDNPHSEQILYVQDKEEGEVVDDGAFKAVSSHYDGENPGAELLEEFAEDDDFGEYHTDLPKH